MVLEHLVLYLGRNWVPVYFVDSLGGNQALDLQVERLGGEVVGNVVGSVGGVRGLAEGPADALDGEEVLVVYVLVKLVGTTHVHTGARRVGGGVGG